MHTLQQQNAISRQHDKISLKYEEPGQIKIE